MWLDADPRAVRAAQGDDSAHRFDLTIVPQTEAPVGDSSLGKDSRGLDDDEAGSAERPGAVVREVEVGRHAVPRAVHAHRRHNNAVF